VPCSSVSVCEPPSCTLVVVGHVSRTAPHLSVRTVTHNSYLLSAP
jgi:hypothetical protein